jgi:hypothetical protein
MNGHLTASVSSSQYAGNDPCMWAVNTINHEGYENHRGIIIPVIQEAAKKIQNLSKQTH